MRLWFYRVLLRNYIVPSQLRDCDGRAQAAR